MLKRRSWSGWLNKLSNSMAQSSRTLAHVLPLVVFLLLSQVIFGLGDWLGLFRAHPSLPWYIQAPEHWVYPLQAVVAGYLVWHFRGVYQLDKPSGRSWLWAVLLGAVGIAAWLLPNYVALKIDDLPEWLVAIGFKQRLDGFDAEVFDSAMAQVITYVWRFVRAVIVVAFVEEICWRGCVMRLGVSLDKNNKYGDCMWQVPFGTHSWLAYLVSTGAFVLVHQPSDWLAAIIYGSLAYILAVKTKSLSACVIMHAVANLLMGWYILQTGQNGLW